MRADARIYCLLCRTLHSNSTGVTAKAVALFVMQVQLNTGCRSVAVVFPGFVTVMC